MRFVERLEQAGFAISRMVRGAKTEYKHRQTDANIAREVKCIHLAREQTLLESVEKLRRLIDYDKNASGIDKQRLMVLAITQEQQDRERYANAATRMALEKLRVKKKVDVVRDSLVYAITFWEAELAKPDLGRDKIFLGNRRLTRLREELSSLSTNSRVARATRQKI